MFNDKVLNCKDCEKDFGFTVLCSKMVHERTWALP